MLQQVRSSLTGLKVIDTDTHLTEPADLWTSRSPRGMCDRMPQIKMRDGTPTWVIDGDTSMGMQCAGSSLRKDGKFVDGMETITMQLPDVHAASYDGRARVAWMDEQGIWAQIIYPNLLGFGGRMALGIDAELRLLTTQIYNDFCAELQAESGNRLLPMALLPWWDIKASVKEAERCHKMGLRGVNMNSDPHLNDLPDLGQDDWTPLYDVCSDLELPINFHIGFSDETMSWVGSWPWPSQRPETAFAIGGVTLFISNAKTLVNLLLSGVLEKHPKLKFVSVESGVGWIPFVLEAVDYQAAGASSKSTSHLSMRPSEYFRRQVYACFWFEKEGILADIRRLGVDNVMFESDFPHPACLSPRPIDFALDALSGLTAEETAKVMSSNAARLYNIPL